MSGSSPTTVLGRQSTVKCLQFVIAFHISHFKRGLREIVVSACFMDAVIEFFRHLISTTVSGIKITKSIVFI